MQTPLNIAFCVSDNYIPYINVTIRSILDNNPNDDFVFHILVDEISKKNEKRLRANFKKDNTEIIIHKVDDSSLSQLKVGSYTKYAWYRILLPEILPNVDKVLYLDADIVINGNIDEFFTCDITNKSIAAILDCSAYDDEVYTRSQIRRENGYVCSGVLLMNLDYWRKHNIKDQIITWALENGEKIKCPDQDAINHICETTKVLLPLKYGFMWLHTFLTDKFLDYKLEETKEAILNPIVIHYAFEDPWIGECDNPYLKLWRKFNKRLTHPAPITYKTKGINGLKVKIWNLFNDRSKSKREWIISKLSLYKNQ